MWKQWKQSIAVSMALCAWAAPAWAGGYCSDKTPCKSASETCQGNYCVPTAKLCTADSTCAAWEKCDFTCPGGMSGGGGSTGTSSSDASVTVTSDGISWSDGGSGFQSQPDAAGVPAQPDADNIPQPDDAYASYDATPIPDDAYWVDNNCPKTTGVCVAVLSKVPVQTGCEAFCAALIPCNLGFGSGTTTSSSGGSGGGTPPSAADAGQTDPAYPDAGQGGSDQPPDFPDAAAQMDAAYYDTNMPQYDGGPIDPGPDAQAQCVSMCSLWVLDHTADTELAAVETCIATQAPNGCSAIEKNCEAQAKAFMTAAEANDAWSIGLGGSFSSSDQATSGGGTKGGDTAPVLGAADAGATGGTESNNAASGAGSSGSSGCTAGATNSGASTSLGLLGLMASAFILRRRQRA